MASPSGIVQFGLFFFGTAIPTPDRYRLLLDCSVFADTHGFRFVSVPERHFHPFGSLSPNPAVLAAAIAARTSRVQIRAGSVVAPLHHTVRIVEDWAVVDNISDGRVAVSLGSGWNINDFVLAPERYEGRREFLWEQFHEVARLWRDGLYRQPTSIGNIAEVNVTPRPVQSSLPIWITASRSIETFRRAGQIGANVLTHLENHDLGELEEKISLYRSARASAGYKQSGIVTLMQHAYVMASRTELAATCQALRQYLSSALDLEHASGAAGGSLSGGRSDLDLMLSDNALRSDLVEHAVTRYCNDSGLIGTLGECRTKIRALGDVGVDEIACLVDFFSESEPIMAGLTRLALLSQEFSDDALRRHADAQLSSFIDRRKSSS